MTRHGSHTESRMRENCTYGSMRGRTYPAGRLALLYTLLGPRAYAKDHADDMYRMPFQTCRDRAKEALGDCCLKVGRKMDTTTRGVLKVEFYK